MTLPFMHHHAFQFSGNFNIHSQISAQLKRETNINLPKMSLSDLKEFLLLNSAAENARLLSSMDVAAHVVKVGSIELTKIKQVNQFLSVQKYYSLLFHNEDVQALKHLKNEVLSYFIDNLAEYQKLFSIIFWINDKPRLISCLFAAGFLQKKDDILLELDRFLPKEFLPAPNRLQTLLSQAKIFQTITCPYHYSSSIEDQALALKEQSLAFDHFCDRKFISTKKVHTLGEHADEIWYTCFSQDSSLLLTTSRDQRAIIWLTNVRNDVMFHV